MSVALFRLNILSVILLSVLSFNAISAPAPDWKLQYSQGNFVSLKDYHGKLLILHFWSTWCPYCKRLQPGLENLCQ